MSVTGSALTSEKGFSSKRGSQAITNWPGTASRRVEHERFGAIVVGLDSRDADSSGQRQAIHSPIMPESRLFRHKDDGQWHMAQGRKGIVLRPDLVKHLFGGEGSSNRARRKPALESKSSHCVMVWW